MLGIAITKDNCMLTKDFKDSTEVRKFLQGHIEVVKPNGLPHPLCLLVDEEGALKPDNKRNGLATLLYGGSIFGNVIIMQEVDLLSGERDISGLDRREAHRIMNILAEVIQKVGANVAKFTVKED